MSDAVLIAICTILGGILGTVIQEIIGSIRGKRKDKADADKVDAEATDVIQKAALALVDPLKKRVLELDAEVCELSEKMDAANKELAVLKSENSDLREENGDLREWAERLVYQVKSLGKQDPVKIRQRKNIRPEATL